MSAKILDLTAYPKASTVPTLKNASEATPLISRKSAAEDSNVLLDFETQKKRLAQKKMHQEISKAAEVAFSTSRKQAESDALMERLAAAQGGAYLSPSRTHLVNQLELAFYETRDELTKTKLQLKNYKVLMGVMLSAWVVGGLLLAFWA